MIMHKETIWTHTSLLCGGKGALGFSLRLIFPPHVIVQILLICFQLLTNS